MHEENSLMRLESKEQATKMVFTPSKYSLEVTGLGMIAALLLGASKFVIEGTLPLSQFLVFAGFLVVSMGGLVWRIVSLAPARTAKSNVASSLHR
jgi:hypothetical protein